MVMLRRAYDTAVVITKNNESNTIGVASEATHPSRIVQEARQPYEDTQDFALLDSKIRNKPKSVIRKKSCHFLMTAIRKIALYILDS